MEKIITIADIDVKLDNNIGWAFAFRDQFGHDIVPTVMPLLAGLFEAAAGLMRETGGKGKITARDFGKLAGTGALDDAFVRLSGVELTDLVNITWAMAKNADNGIPEPSRWVRQFETFPLDEVAPAVGELIVKGLTSSKNWERLQEMMKGLKPSK